MSVLDTDFGQMYTYNKRSLFQKQLRLDVRIILLQHMQCKADQKQCVLKTWEMTLRLEVVYQVFRVTIGHGGDVIHITLDNHHASSSSLPPPPPRWSPGRSQKGLSSPPISSTGLQTYTYICHRYFRKSGSLENN